jgi:hypothetical protein
MCYIHSLSFCFCFYDIKPCFSASWSSFFITQVYVGNCIQQMCGKIQNQRWMWHWLFSFTISSFKYENLKFMCTPIHSSWFLGWGWWWNNWLPWNIKLLDVLVLLSTHITTHQMKISWTVQHIQTKMKPTCNNKRI